MPSSLKTFIEEMSDYDPSWCFKIEKYIRPEKYEVSALAKHLEDTNINKGLFFENTSNLLGTKSELKLLINTFAQRKFCAVALGLSPEKSGSEIADTYSNMKKLRGEVTIIPGSEAPCQEIVWTGEQIDLRKFPVPMLHEKDVGPYFSMANIMKSKYGDFYDITFTKNLIIDYNKMTLSANPRFNLHHLTRINNEYMEKKEPTPVVIVLGHHPAFFLGAQAAMSYGNNDYYTVSSFLREPLRLTPSLTWGKDFLVPADAEIIIEGEVIPGAMHKQNPYGEFSGHYQAERLAPVIEVRAISQRREAIMQTIFCGHMDVWNINSVVREGDILESLRESMQGDISVHFPTWGCGVFACNIALEKISPADVQQVGMKVLSTFNDCKIVTIVDRDIDIYNQHEVLWAIATQAKFETDFTRIPNALGFRPHFGTTAVIIDATLPDDPNFPEKNQIPKNILDNIKIETFLNTKDL